MELVSFIGNTTVTEIQWQAYPIAILLLFLCLFTILGNLLIIYTIIRDKTLHSARYYYIASLAFADFLVGLIAMPFAFIFEMTHDEYWLFNRHLRVLCDFWQSMDIFASTASIFGLCAIGIDRYISITKSIKYHSSFISKHWCFNLSFIWLCSAALSFPAVIHVGTKKRTAGPLSELNETISTYSNPLIYKECEFPNNSYYLLFTSILSFYIPTIVMVYVYVKVYTAARRQSKALRSGYKNQYLTRASLASEGNRHSRERSKSPPPPQLVTLRIHHGRYQNPSCRSISKDGKTTRRRNFWRKISRDQKAGTFVGLVMGAFVICWLPYFVYFLLIGVFGIRLADDESHELLFRILSWLGYTNSALDVLIYIFTTRELRETFAKFFRRSETETERIRTPSQSDCQFQEATPMC